MNFETTIGLEVHVQLNTKTKLFCACATSFAEHQNTNTCPTAVKQHSGVIFLLT